MHNNSFEKAHHISWNRQISADGNFRYVLRSDGKDVYVMEGSTEGKTQLDLLRMHQAFVDTAAYYRRHGVLPGRTERGLVVKHHLL